MVMLKDFFFRVYRDTVELKSLPKGKFGIQEKKKKWFSKPDNPKISSFERKFFFKFNEDKSTVLDGNSHIICNVGFPISEKAFRTFLSCITGEDLDSLDDPSSDYQYHLEKEDRTIDIAYLVKFFSEEILDYRLAKVGVAVDYRLEEPKKGNIEIAFDREKGNQGPLDEVIINLHIEKPEEGYDYSENHEIILKQIGKDIASKKCKDIIKSLDELQPRPAANGNSGFAIHRGKEGESKQAADIYRKAKPEQGAEATPSQSSPALVQISGNQVKKDNSMPTTETYPDVSPADPIIDFWKCVKPALKKGYRFELEDKKTEFVITCTQTPSGVSNKDQEDTFKQLKEKLQNFKCDELKFECKMKIVTKKNKFSKLRIIERGENGLSKLKPVFFASPATATSTEQSSATADTAPLPCCIQ
jgi:hypothetical protein